MTLSVICELLKDDDIVSQTIFAKKSLLFYWGGNWYFYDIMHFEYRPKIIYQLTHR